MAVATRFFPVSYAIFRLMSSCRLFVAILLAVFFFGISGSLRDFYRFSVVLGPDFLFEYGVAARFLLAFAGAGFARMCGDVGVCP
jgi:hypothetical protein